MVWPAQQNAFMPQCGAQSWSLGNREYLIPQFMVENRITNPLTGGYHLETNQQLNSNWNNKSQNTNNSAKKPRVNRHQMVKNNPVEAAPLTCARCCGHIMTNQNVNQPTESKKLVKPSKQNNSKIKRNYRQILNGCTPCITCM